MVAKLCRHELSPGRKQVSNNQQMLALPLSGVLLSNSYKSGNVPLFWITAPDLFPENPAVVELARSLHFWLSYTFASVIGLHLWQQQKVVRAYWRRILSLLPASDR